MGKSMDSRAAWFVEHHWARGSQVCIYWPLHSNGSNFSGQQCHSQNLCSNGHFSASLNTLSVWTFEAFSGRLRQKPWRYLQSGKSGKIYFVEMLHIIAVIPAYSTRTCEICCAYVLLLWSFHVGSALVGPWQCTKKRENFHILKNSKQNFWH